MSEGSLTSVEARQKLSRVVPAEIADIFGHPPVLSTEKSSSLRCTDDATRTRMETAKHHRMDVCARHY